MRAHGALPQDRQMAMSVTPETMATTEEATSGHRPGAGSVLTPAYRARRLLGETGRRSTITQIYEGTNQIQRVVMARQLLK
jgi:alkylation response protein AidB-like acyl-CoA dehydrogenase